MKCKLILDVIYLYSFYGFLPDDEVSAKGFIIKMSYIAGLGVKYS
jgi:hypothetical protein